MQFICGFVVRAYMLQCALIVVVYLKYVINHVEYQTI